MLTFTEVQQNKARWFATAFSVVTILVGYIWTSNNVTFSVTGTFISGGLIYVSATSMMFFLRLDTRIDDRGVHIRTPYAFAKWQHIPWSEIDRIYVREYALLGEYPQGIMGFRQGPGGFAFAPLYGVHGLQIEKANGGRYLLGTQRPDELKQWLVNRSISKPVSPE